MATYSYALHAFRRPPVSVELLHEEVLADVLITPVLRGVTEMVGGTWVMFDFVTSLSTEEKIRLDIVVGVHGGGPPSLLESHVPFLVSDTEVFYT